MLDHERLDVYQAAVQLLALTHRVIAKLPRGNATIAELVDTETHSKGKELLVRIVSMLSKMC